MSYRGAARLILSSSNWVRLDMIQSLCYARLTGYWLLHIKESKLWPFYLVYCAKCQTIPIGPELEPGGDNQRAWVSVKFKNTSLSTSKAQLLTSISQNIILVLWYNSWVFSMKKKSVYSLSVTFSFPWGIVGHFISFSENMKHLIFILVLWCINYWVHSYIYATFFFKFSHNHNWN